MTASNRVQELAEHLEGSCESIGDQQHGWTESEVEEFDNLVFRCEQCGWWLERGDAVGNDMCVPCSEDLS